jgi:hypothetical protein
LSWAKRSVATVGEVIVVQAAYPVFFNMRANPEAQRASSSTIRIRAFWVMLVGGTIAFGATPVIKGLRFCLTKALIAPLL